jgi:hypothetical protein
MRQINCWHATVIAGDWVAWKNLSDTIHVLESAMTALQSKIISELLTREYVITI